MSLVSLFIEVVVSKFILQYWVIAMEISMVSAVGAVPAVEVACESIDIDNYIPKVDPEASIIIVGASVV